MRYLLAVLLSYFSIAASATTLNPIQLLNPAGSSSGQVIVSTGASTAPAWGGIGVNSIAAIAANTVLVNATGSSAAPTAFAMPNCSTSASALAWTSGTGFTCNASINAATLGGATFASPGAIGSTTPSTGAFTTLNASGNDALFYSNTSAQSFTSGTAATVTGWTKVFDRVNTNFNAATGVYTAPTTGFYMVCAGLQFAANTGALNTSGQLLVVANAVNVFTNVFIRQTTSSDSMTVNACGLVSLAATQTIVIQGLQNTGGAVALNAAATVNFVSINRVP